VAITQKVATTAFFTDLDFAPTRFSIDPQNKWADYRRAQRGVNSRNVVLPPPTT
jgi:hypothetical protein